MASPPGPDAASPQDRCAAALLEAAIETCHELGVEPARMAPLLNGQLLKAYGIETRVPLPVILRALRAWKPSTQTIPSRGLLRLVSTECPIADRATRDPAACRICRQLQRELIAVGLGTPREAIEFTRTRIDGDPECEARIHLAPA